MTSIWHTPSMVQNFMNKFPLVSHPPVSNYSNEDMLISKRQFKFRPLSDLQNHTMTPDSSFTSTLVNDSNTNSRFQLGIYNAVPLSYNKEVLGSLDPLCLCSMLIISHKGGFRLPLMKKEYNKRASRGGSKGDGVEGFCSLLSCHSSTDGELPILVEDEDNRKQKQYKRKIRSTTIINEMNMSNVKNPAESMLIELLDTVLYDFFLTVVLTELQDAQKIKLFSLNKEDENSSSDEIGLFDRATLPGILGSLVKRYNYHIRNPIISEQYLNYTSKIVPNLQWKAVESEKKYIVEQGLEKIKELEGLIGEKTSRNGGDSSNNPVTVFELPGEEISLFDLKLASYIYCILNIEGTNSFAEIKSTCPKLASHCEAIIRGVI